MSPRVSERYKNDKIQCILESAKRVFIRKGFDETTMQDIVDECNISRGGLYRYFSSTEEIFAALMESDMQEDKNGIEGLMEMDWSAYEIIKAFVEAEKNSILHIHTTLLPAAYEFFIKSRRNHKELDFLTKRHDIALKALSRLIEYGVQRGEFSRKVNAEEVSGYIITFVEGLIITAISIGTEEKSIDSHCKLLLEFIDLHLKA